jgi:hypothetical protein
MALSFIFIPANKKPDYFQYNILTAITNFCKPLPPAARGTLFEKTAPLDPP